jgi:hypothetical protein
MSKQYIDNPSVLMKFELTVQAILALQLINQLMVHLKLLTFRFLSRKLQRFLFTHV